MKYDKILDTFRFYDSIFFIYGKERSVLYYIGLCGIEVREWIKNLLSRHPVLRFWERSNLAYRIQMSKVVMLNSSKGLLTANFPDCLRNGTR